MKLQVVTHHPTPIIEQVVLQGVLKALHENSWSLRLLTVTSEDLEGATTFVISSKAFDNIWDEVLHWLECYDASFELSFESPEGMWSWMLYTPGHGFKCVRDYGMRLDAVIQNALADITMDGTHG